MHAISIKDVIDDIKFQFNPNYKGLLLVSDGGPTEAVKKKKYRYTFLHRAQTHKAASSRDLTGTCGNYGLVI